MLFRRLHASKLGAYVEKIMTEVEMRYLFCLVI